MFRIIASIYNSINGRFVGDDIFGNRYYESRSHVTSVSGIISHRRWVSYKTIVEPSKIPANWHNWLHHTTDNIPSKSDAKIDSSKILPNLTGTIHRHLPKGHASVGTARQNTVSDYKAWKPSISNRFASDVVNRHNKSSSLSKPLSIKKSKKYKK